MLAVIIASVSSSIIFALLGYSLKSSKVITKYYSVDRSGVSENPPKRFIEVWQGKTLNLKIDELEIIIPPLPALMGIDTIEKLMVLHMSMRELSQQTPKTTREVKELNEKILKMYIAYIDIIYLLSCDDIGGFFKKRKYYKKLKSKMINNYEVGLSITNEIYKYLSWMGLKKKALLGGKCFEETYGGGYIWNSSGKDDLPKKLITPRYDYSTSISTRRTKEQQKK